MKCEKHGCELVEGARPPGWAAKGKMVCPQCEAESAEVNIRLAVSSQGAGQERKREAPRRGGWQ